MIKATLTLAVGALMLSLVSCSSTSAPASCPTKACSSCTKKACSSCDKAKKDCATCPSTKKKTAQVRYHHSPNPIASKTGLQVAQVR